MAFDINEYLARGAPQPEPEDPMFYVRKPEPPPEAQNGGGPLAARIVADLATGAAIEPSIPQTASEQQGLQVTEGPRRADGELPSAPIETGDAPTPPPDTGVDRLAMLGEREKRGEEEKKRFLEEWKAAQLEDMKKKAQAGWGSNENVRHGLSVFAGVPYVAPHAPDLATDDLIQKEATLAKMEAAYREPEAAWVAGQALKEKQDLMKRQRDPKSSESAAAMAALEELSPNTYNRLTNEGKKKIAAADVDPYLKMLSQYGVGMARASGSANSSAGRLELARAKFIQDIADKNKAHYVIDSNTGAVYDSNGKVQPTESTLEFARKHGLKIERTTVPQGISAAAPAGGAGWARPPDPNNPMDLGVTNGLPPPSAPPAEGEKPKLPGEIKPPVYNKVVDTQKKALNTALEESARGAGRSVQNAAEVKRRAGAVEALVGPVDENGYPKGDLTPEQMAELAISVNTMLSNGQGNVTQFKELVPRNLEITKAKFMEFFKGEPYPANQKEWAKFWLELARREKGAAQKFIYDTLIPRIPGARGQLHTISPTEYESVLKAHKINPASLDANGVPIKGMDPVWYDDKELDKPHQEGFVVYKYTGNDPKQKLKRAWGPPGLKKPDWRVEAQ